jgi:hypothetical protein
MKHLRFSTRTMLAVAALFALGMAWYGNRLRTVEREREQLSEAWLILASGEISRVGGKVRRFDVEAANVTLLPPENGIGRIDFAMLDGSGTSRAIYQRKGDLLKFASAEVGRPRPTDFTPARNVYVWYCMRENPKRGPRK